MKDIWYEVFYIAGLVSERFETVEAARERAKELIAVDAVDVHIVRMETVE